MAKTLVTMDERTIIDNIDGEALKAAFASCCAVARGEKETSALEGIAKDVHDLQVFADKLTDLGKAISDAVKSAEGRYFEDRGDVTDGFKLRNTGSTVSVKDTDGLISEAILLGYNDGALRTRLTISAKDAMAAMGIDKERFESEFADFIEIKKKADTLVRSY